MEYEYEYDDVMELRSDLKELEAWSLSRIPGLEHIIKFFESIGCPMEHFPDDGESFECWQFDGDLDGVVIQVIPRTRGVTVSIDIPAGDCFAETLPIKELESATNRADFEAWARKCLEV